ncbi:effector protein Tle3 domain-containing protein [Janthinobacterium lividum]|uniref:effector protein Tle3 domain-containing protein n=1 Tax=Janthinobacterium lividum TaxID=29581 RepID=UPI0015F16841|nr:DUF3274 domain-containing protein [Janthinobacterium lividum]
MPRKEDEHAHVEASVRGNRGTHKAVAWPINTKLKPVEQRNGIRTITGEALCKPVPADLRGTSQIDPPDIPVSSTMHGRPKKDEGPMEAVDPNDAATAVTSGRGLISKSEERPDPSGYRKFPESVEALRETELQKMTVAYNKEKKLDEKGPLAQRKVISATRDKQGNVWANVQESPNEARLRWQREVSAKSFHSSIIGNMKNHSQVTAYDVAIGSGKASSDPQFYEYLCAVADWRVKDLKTNEKGRKGMRIKEKFLSDFAAYLSVEPAWRKAAINGGIDYYNTGICLQGFHCYRVLYGRSLCHKQKT